MDSIENFTYFLLVLSRVSGCILFNQIFGRGNLPIIYKIGMTIMLTITAYNLVPPLNTIVINSVIEYFYLVSKEIFIGYIIGFMITMFLSIFNISGDIIDLQIGMSMAKIYDPKSNISMGVMGTLVNIYFMFVFLCANGHLTLLQIFFTSFKVIDVGNFMINDKLYLNIVQLLSYILIYSVKLALPILAVEIIAEVGMGIMMKAIPQIQVFTVNMQLKLFIGITIMLILVPTMSSFLERLMTLMFETIQNSLSILI